MQPKALKKEINKNWSDQFPYLSSYTLDKLYKKTDPVILGLDLFRLPGGQGYRPYLVCFPLWEPSVDECFKAPILLKPILNRKRLQFSIEFDDKLKLDEAISCTKEQVGEFLNGDVSLNDLRSLIDAYSKELPLAAAPNSYIQADLQKKKLYILLYTGNEEAIQKSLSFIEGKNWDLQHFKQCKIDFKEWFKGLEHEVKNRDNFLERIKVNKEDKKLVEMKEYQLTY